VPTCDCTAKLPAFAVCPSGHSHVRVLSAVVNRLPYTYFMCIASGVMNIIHMLYGPRNITRSNEST